MGRKRRKKRRGTVAVATAERSSPTRRIPPLVPWRDRCRAALEALETWVHDRHGGDLEDALRRAAGGGPRRPADRERILDDLVCTPGSAPEGRSLLRACAVECRALDDEARDQFLRWERERRRGVFVIQRAHEDALEVWDPLEGAPLTLHLLHRPTEREAACAIAGTVITATFRPWLARLILVHAPEYFPGDEAIPMFRREVEGSGVTWHPIPSAAPVRSSSRLGRP